MRIWLILAAIVAIGWGVLTLRGSSAAWREWQARAEAAEVRVEELGRESTAAEARADSAGALADSLAALADSIAAHRPDVGPPQAQALAEALEEPEPDTASVAVAAIERVGILEDALAQADSQVVALEGALRFQQQQTTDLSLALEAERQRVAELEAVVAAVPAPAPWWHPTVTVAVGPGCSPEGCHPVGVVVGAGWRVRAF